MLSFTDYKYHSNCTAFKSFFSFPSFHVDSLSSRHFGYILQLEKALARSRSLSRTNAPEKWPVLAPGGRVLPHVTAQDRCSRLPGKHPLRMEAIKRQAGTSLVVQWVRLHAPNAGGRGLIPGQETRSHMHATTKKSVCRN